MTTPLNIQQSRVIHDTVNVLAKTSPIQKVEIERDFRKSLGKARLLMTKNVLLKEEIHSLYGLFQQATVGNCNDWKVFRNLGATMLDLQSKAKFAAWVNNRGLDPTRAKALYTIQVDLLAMKYCVVFPTSLSSRYGSVASLATCSTAVSNSVYGNADTISIAGSDISLL